MRCRQAAALTGGDRRWERRSGAVHALVELTRQEFDLLHQLVSRPGIVYSRAALLRQVWSDDRFVTERTVDTVVSRLRRKIERDPQDPELILTAGAWATSLPTWNEAPTAEAAAEPLGKLGRGDYISIATTPV